MPSILQPEFEMHLGFDVTEQRVKHGTGAILEISEKATSCFGPVSSCTAMVLLQLQLQLQRGVGL
jgi:hypothetical protein